MFFARMWGYKMNSLKEFVENKERKKKHEWFGYQENN